MRDRVAPTAGGSSGDRLTRGCVYLCLLAVWLPSSNAITELPEYLSRLPTAAEIQNTSLAICLTGERRTLLRNGENIMSNIVEPIKANARLSWVTAVIKTDECCRDDILPLLRLGTADTYIVTHNQEKLHNKVNRDRKVGKGKCERITPTSWHQFVVQKMCFGKVKEKEDELGIRFDWIMRIRPDILYDVNVWRPILTWPFWADRTQTKWYASCKCSRSDLIGPKFDRLPIADVFAVVPRNAAEVYFSTVNEHMDQCIDKNYWKKCYMRGNGADDPECYMVNRMERHGFVTHAVPSLWFTNASNYGPRVWSGGARKTDGLYLDPKRKVAQECPHCDPELVAEEQATMSVDHTSQAAVPAWPSTAASETVVSGDIRDYQARMKERGSIQGAPHPGGELGSLWG